MGDLFIFATEDGTIAAWQPSNAGTAVLRADNSAGMAIYKGVTIASPLTALGRVQLYAADFHNNKIDVWDDQYMPVTSLGNFTDPNLPAGFAPFNVHGLGPLLLVTYAKQSDDAVDDVKGPGNGFVDVFSAEGFFLQRLISGGQLNSPWGDGVRARQRSRVGRPGRRQLRRRHDQHLQPVAEGPPGRRALGGRAGRRVDRQPAGDRRAVGARVRLGPGGLRGGRDLLHRRPERRGGRAVRQPRLHRYRK